MEIVGWDERQFYMEHLFTIGDKIMAKGTSSGVIIGRE